MSVSIGRLMQLEPITLEHVDRVAGLQVRVDRKYIVRREELGEIASVWDFGMRVLEIEGRREFSYESVYFDTPELDTYFASARSRPHRHKVRTRSYLDLEQTALEVKTRNRKGMTIKQRLQYPYPSRSELTEDALDFVSQHWPTQGEIARLQAMLIVRYRRSTVLDPVTRSRITIDTGLEGLTPDGKAIVAPEFALIEVKSPGPVTTADRLLWAGGRRPVTVSKYCTLLAALNPGLPANKWNRTLRSNFDWAPSRLQGRLIRGDEVSRRPAGVGLIDS